MGKGNFLTTLVIGWYSTCTRRRFDHASTCRILVRWECCEFDYSLANGKPYGSSAIVSGILRFDVRTKIPIHIFASQLRVLVTASKSRNHFNVVWSDNVYWQVAGARRRAPEDSSLQCRLRWEKKTFLIVVIFPGRVNENVDYIPELRRINFG